MSVDAPGGTLGVGELPGLQERELASRGPKTEEAVGRSRRWRRKEQESSPVRGR